MWSFLSNVVEFLKEFSQARRTELHDTNPKPLKALKHVKMA